MKYGGVAVFFSQERKVKGLDVHRLSWLFHQPVAHLLHTQPRVRLLQPCFQCYIPTGFFSFAFAELVQCAHPALARSSGYAPLS